MRKILIAGTMSGSGKTTISSILMSAFENVAPFKVGPDYIDPTYHKVFTGNKSYNLDTFMHNEEILKYIFYSNSEGKDISIVEGVMGLYDGIDHTKNNFSTAHVSRILDIPVILVVNAKGISTSIAAEVLGFKQFDERVNIAGVILNNVSSKKSYYLLKEAIEMYTDIECLGYIPKNDKFDVESRHLGLKQAFELENNIEKKDFFHEIAKECLNLDKIYKIAECNIDTKFVNPAKTFIDTFKGKRVAIAYDKAFSFYYESNFDLMRYSGMELVYFSLLNDKELPKNIDYIYLGGGYPELYAKELEENVSMKNAILEAAKSGIRIYAECGGFIYLTKGLKDLEDRFYNFCGIFDLKIKMRNRLNIGRFGYINIELENGIKTRGHEFHYSEIYDNNESEYMFDIKKKDGREWNCGYIKDNVLAGYPHISFYSNLEFFKFLFKT